jgi:hypothetical protein
MTPEERFDKAFDALPTAYKALMVSAAFNALNVEGVARMIAVESECNSTEMLQEAAGVFLDLKAVLDTTKWQQQIASHVDASRSLNEVGEWMPPFGAA